MNELKDIWNDSGRRGLQEEQLLAYLEGRLSPGEQHEVERFLAEEGLEGDALEGLRQLAPEEARRATGRLQQALHRQLHERKGRRGRYITGNRWAWVAVLVVLALALLAYMLIRMSMVQAGQSG